MRPRQSRLGIFRLRGTNWYGGYCFNEAEAITPRNLQASDRRPSLPTLASMRPRQSRLGIVGGCTVVRITGLWSFNEAEAITPRNRATALPLPPG